MSRPDYIDVWGGTLTFAFFPANQAAPRSLSLSLSLFDEEEEEERCSTTPCVPTLCAAKRARRRKTLPLEETTIWTAGVGDAGVRRRQGLVRRSAGRRRDVPRTRARRARPRDRRRALLARERSRRAFTPRRDRDKKTPYIPRGVLSTTNERRRTYVRTTRD